MTSEYALQRVLTSCVYFAAFIVVGFLGVRIYEGVQVQKKQAAMQAEIEDLRARLQVVQKGQAQRLSIIESFAFGQLTAEVLEQTAKQEKQEKQEKRKRPTVDWMLVRDQAMNARITRLERWRLAIQDRCR